MVFYSRKWVVSCLLGLVLAQCMVLRSNCLPHDPSCNPEMVTVLFPGGTRQVTEVWPGASILGLLQTGQTTIFAAGDDGDLQRTLERSFADRDGTVFDAVTGLTWQRCSAGQTNDSGCSGAASTMDWTSAMSYCSIHGSEWRLPTLQEMATLLHLGAGSVPFTYSTYFPNTPDTPGFFTATEHGLNPVSNAFYSQFSNGWISTTTKAGVLYVRCVKGPIAPSAPAFADQGDGTIRETVTNLIWQKCLLGQTNDASCTGAASTMNWATAVDACNNLSLGGLAWRLPNRNEIISLLDFTKNAAPAIDTTYFPNNPTGNSWTGSTQGTSGLVGRYAGNGSTGSLKTNNEVARCVSGP